jgi:hypothetical protein
MQDNTQQAYKIIKGREPTLRYYKRFHANIKEEVDEME